MQKTPRDKMVKTSPKKKNVKTGKAKPKKKAEEVEAEVAEQVELTPEEKKETDKIGRAIVEHKDEADVWDNLSPEQINLVKRTLAVGATDDELKMFINVCKGARLNPYLKQVHFVKRWNSKEGKEVGAIQVGIDGYRAIAEEGGQYAGNDDAIFKDETEITTKQGKKTVPGQATVAVYKLLDGTRCAFTATARWSEYYPGAKAGYMWDKMPYGQLAKCAESLALRKAFPKLLGGMYTSDEMEQATPQESMVDKTDQMCSRAKAMIAKATDFEALEGLKVKLDKSANYNAGQKVELKESVDVRLMELTEKLELK